MANFSKYSNYNENTSYSSVVFGADAPLLEVELNELQQILNTKLNRLVKTVLGGSSFTALTPNSITYNNVAKMLTFNDCIAVADNGWTAYVHGAALQLNTTSYNAVYVQLQEVEKVYSDTLKSYGNTVGGNVPNTMKDGRSPVETSKRKVITFTIKTGSTVPADTETTKNILIGSWNGSTLALTRSITNRIEKLESQMGGLTLGVENGLLYVETPEE